MPARLPLIFFALALAAALWRAPMPQPADFAGPAEIPASTPASDFFSEKLPEVQGQIGASSIARLPDGRLLVVWLENRSGEAEDSQLRLLTQDRHGNWLAATSIANRASVAASSFAYLSHIDQPLLYAEGNWLHLYFVSHALADWRGAALIHTFSSDGGKSWSAQRKLHIAPPLNGGKLRLLPVHSLNAGELALPLLEGEENRGSWLRLSATGKPLDKLRLQENEIVLPQGVASIKQPEGVESFLAISDKHLLAAGHPQGNRKQLLLWQSLDGGASWLAGRPVEQADDGAAEFAHPFLLQAADGRIHLTYTWRRQAIKHLSFTTRWLTEGGKP